MNFDDVIATDQIERKFDDYNQAILVTTPPKKWHKNIPPYNRIMRALSSHLCYRYYEPGREITDVPVTSAWMAKPGNKVEP